MSEAPIVAHFELLRLARESRKYTLSSSGQSVRYQIFFDSCTDDIIEEIKKLKEANTSFFEKYDYDWCLSPGAYSNALEAANQRDLLKVAASLSPDLSSKLSNVAVRLIGTAELNGHSFESGGFKYITLSTSLFRSISRLYFMFTQFRKFFKCWTMEELNGILKDRFHEARIELVRFTESLLACARYSPQTDPDFLRIDALDLELELFVSAVGKEYAGNPSWVRRFVVAHEISHLLFHDISNSERNEVEEVVADTGALKLMLDVFGSPVKCAEGAAVFFGLCAVYLVAVGYVEMEDAHREGREPNNKIGELKIPIFNRAIMLKEDVKAAGEDVLRHYENTLEMMENLRLGVSRVILEDLLHGTWRGGG